VASDDIPDTRLLGLNVTPAALNGKRQPSHRGAPPRANSPCRADGGPVNQIYLPP